MTGDIRTNEQILTEALRGQRIGQLFVTPVGAQRLAALLVTALNDAGRLNDLNDTGAGELDLDAIEAAAAAATAGPWKFGNGYGFDQNAIVSTTVYSGISPVWVADADQVGAPENGQFIARARADVPALVAEVRRLRGILSFNGTGPGQTDADLTTTDTGTPEQTMARTLRIDFTAQLEGQIRAVDAPEDASSRDLVVSALGRLLPSGLTVAGYRAAVEVSDVSEVNDETEEPDTEYRTVDIDFTVIVEGQIDAKAPEDESSSDTVRRTLATLLPGELTVGGDREAVTVTDVEEIDSDDEDDTDAS